MEGLNKRQWKVLVACSLIAVLLFSVEYAGNVLEAWPYEPGTVNENPYNPSDYAVSLVFSFMLGVLAILSTCFDIFK